MLLTERYEKKIAGVLSCYDRIIIQGAIPGWCFDKGMASFLSTQNIRVFDYQAFANDLREEIRENAERIKDILKGRGDHSRPCPYLLRHGILHELQSVA